MPAAVAGATNLGSGPCRRSPRLKNIHRLYDEDSGPDSSIFKRIKTEVIDLEEVSPSTSELNVTSASVKDCGEDFDNVSLKDLRARCKAKSQKASNNTFEGSAINNLTENAKEEFDLDKPLIALKRRKQNKSPAKANGKIDALKSSPCAVTVEGTISKRDKVPSPAQSSPLKATGHETETESLEKGTEVEHSKFVIDCTEEIVEDQICCVEVEGTSGGAVSCGNSDILSEIKVEDIEYSEEFGTSSCSKKNFPEFSSFELQQELIEGDDFRPQPCFISQPIDLADVSDDSCDKTCSAKLYTFSEALAQKASSIISSLNSINEVSDDQKPSQHITNSDMDKSSIGNGFLVHSVSQSCDGHIDDDHLNTGVVEGNDPESVKVLEELSPIDESATDMMSPLVDIHSELCCSTEMKCTSLEEDVQMHTEGHLNSVVCCSARPKQMLLDVEVEHAAADYTFDFDKTIDLAQPANFVAQDGELESIVYDVLNNHSQRMTSENRSSVGLPHTAVIQCPVININDSCPDGKISLPNNAEWSFKDMNKLHSTYGIGKSVSNEGSEEVVLQGRLFQAESTSGVTSKISNAEDIEERPIRVPNPSVTSMETDGQIKQSEFFIEESVEQHAPKKLFSKREIMSPTSQESLCNALTGIDLCDGTEGLKRKIVLEDRDKTIISLPQPAHKQDQSMFSTDRRRNGRASVSPPSRVLQSTESPPRQQTTCSCGKNSPVVLDTEKAVEFSQRQMHDIENIATKLMRSLKQMKSIVDESLSLEAYSSVPNFSTAEIRAASEDALEVEKTTKKWLAIMNKDCNRFCKILTLAKKKAVSHSEAPRKQRKITFADEAGGKLCHIKVFKDEHTSLLSECQGNL
ncbi:hypothetical protein ACP70R_004279 [Stipagrostis hirtigluma subsp. patula]